MMSFIKSVIYIILSSAIGFFTYKLFGYFTPSYMGLGWLWLILIFLFMGSLLVALISFLPRLLSAFIVRLRSFHGLESFLISIALIVFCFYTCRDAWLVEGSYTGKQIFAAVTQNLLALQVFSAVYRSLVAYKKVIIEKDQY